MNMKHFLKNKERAWRSLLKTQDGELNESAKIALADLRYFCNGTKSNFSVDALEMARMEGRREVFMRIMTFLNFEYSKLYDLEEDVVDE